MFLKRIISFIGAIGLCVSLLTITVLASHPIPNNPYGTCTSSERRFTHGGFSRNGNVSNHYIPGLCRKTEQLYNHNQYCRYCNFLFNSNTVFMCRIVHSGGCPTEYPNSLCR